MLANMLCSLVAFLLNMSPILEQNTVRASLSPPWQHSCTHPDPSLGEVGPYCNLLSGAHVRVAVPLKGGLQFLQLLASEVCSLPPLLLLQRAILGAGLVQLVLLGFLCVYRHTGYNTLHETQGGSDSNDSIDYQTAGREGSYMTVQ